MKINRNFVCGECSNSFSSMLYNTESVDEERFEMDTVTGFVDGWITHTTKSYSTECPDCGTLCVYSKRKDFEIHNTEVANLDVLKVLLYGLLLVCFGVSITAIFLRW